MNHDMIMHAGDEISSSFEKTHVSILDNVSILDFTGGARHAIVSSIELKSLLLEQFLALCFYSIQPNQRQ